MRLGLLVVGLLSLGLIACAPVRFAPLTEMGWYRHFFIPSYYQVSRGDTLYSVAFRYDLDYRVLAYYNHLSPPYRIRVGQRLWLKGAHVEPAASFPKRKPRSLQPITRPYVPHSYHRSASTTLGAPQFVWPARGKIGKFFSPDHGRKGIDIYGHFRERVRSAGSGIVAYAGNGLVGYGNLIIIKHSHHYLTAYGYLAHSDVKEGQKVAKGQVIGDMGRVDRKFWGVHFEIRNKGKPVNPLVYLK